MELEKEIKQSKFKSDYHKAIVNIMYTGGWLHNINTGILKPFGISVQQFNLLRILRGQHPKPITVSELQNRMLDKMSNASRLVDKLKAKDLLVRHTPEEDRRRAHVLITEEGLKLLEKLDHIMNDLEERFKTISPQEAQELNILLDKFRD